MDDDKETVTLTATREQLVRLRRLLADPQVRQRALLLYEGWTPFQIVAAIDAALQEDHHAV